MHQTRSLRMRLNSICYPVLSPRAQESSWGQGEGERGARCPSSQVCVTPGQLCCLRKGWGQPPPMGGVFLGFTLNHSKTAAAGHEDTVSPELPTPPPFTLGKEAAPRTCPQCCGFPAEGASSGISRTKACHSPSAGALPALPLGHSEGQRSPKWSLVLRRQKSGSADAQPLIVAKQITTGSVVP